MNDPLERHVEAFRDETERASLSPAERAAVWSSLDAKRGRPPRARLLVPAVAFAAVAMAVVIASVFMRLHERTWYMVSDDTKCVGHGDEIIVSDSCASSTIEVGDDRIEARGGTRVVRDGGHLRLRSGSARFTVARRKKGQAPFELLMSHGTIRVLGTVFTVDQAEGRGELRLETGSVEIVWNDGAPPTRVAPGESIVWPRPEVPPPVEPEKNDPDEVPEPTDRADDTRTPPSNGRDAKAIEAIMQKEFQLRAQRRYKDAIALLLQAEKRQGLTSVQRERFAFEIGHLLELDDRHDEACTHWRTLSRRFPASARRAEVRERLQSCPSQ